METNMNLLRPLTDEQTKTLINNAGFEGYIATQHELGDILDNGIPRRFVITFVPDLGHEIIEFYTENEQVAYWQSALDELDTFPEDDM